MQDYDTALHHLENIKPSEDPNPGLLLVLYFVIYLEKQDMENVYGTIHKLAQIENNISFLIYAVERAHAKGIKSLVKIILKEMLDAKIDLTVLENKKALIVILRCLVRMNEQAMSNLSENEKALYGEETMKYISRAHPILKTCLGTLDETLDKEIIWFLKSCWNMGIHLEIFTLQSACFYEKVLDFAELKWADLTRVENEMKEILIISCICSLQKRIQFILNSDNEQEKQGHLSFATKTLTLLKTLSDTFNEQVSFLEFQMQILLKDWENLILKMESQDFLNLFSVIYLKRMADFLILSSNCSSGVLFITIKVFHSCECNASQLKLEYSELFNEKR